MSVQYMTKDGDWACSCHEGTPPPSVAVVPAPADADGFYGREGTRWDGKVWVEDPGASARAFAVMYPDQALAHERAGMVADKWQVVAALSRLHPGAWAGVLAYRSAVDEQGKQLCDEIVAAAIDYAITLPRVSQTVELLAYLLDLDAVQVDEVFRLAMAMRG